MTRLAVDGNGQHSNAWLGCCAVIGGRGRLIAATRRDGERASRRATLAIADKVGNGVSTHKVAVGCVGHALPIGGGEPDCTVWYFADHNYQWPNGNSLTPGPHTLRAQVNAADGRQQYVEQPVTIE
jgi:hypothetical protein